MRLQFIIKTDLKLRETDLQLVYNNIEHENLLISFFLGGNMSEFITLACPSCGGKLQITNDIERFACAHCGTEMLVRRGEGIISLKPVIDEVKGVRRAADHTAAELAMARIQKEIEFLNNQLRLRNTRGEYIFLFVGIFGILFSLSFVKDYGALCNGVAIGFVISVISNIFTILKKEKGRKEIQTQLYEKIGELNKHLDTVNRIE